MWLLQLNHRNRGHVDSQQCDSKRPSLSSQDQPNVACSRSHPNAGATKSTAATFSTLTGPAVIQQSQPQVVTETSVPSHIVSAEPFRVQVSVQPLQPGIVPVSYQDATHVIPRPAADNPVGHEDVRFEEQTNKVSQPEQGRKRKYDKVNVCTYCSKEMKSKMTRHLLKVHMDEVDVYQMALLPKKSKERRALSHKLLYEGNFKHNISAINSGGRMFIVGRRTRKSHKEYLPCDLCGQFLLVTSLSAHRKICQKNQQPTNDKPSTAKHRTSAVAKSKAVYHTALLTGENAQLVTLINGLQRGEVKDIVIKDDLIKKDASLRLEGLGSVKHQKPDDINRVRQICRTLGRLVQNCRAKLPNVTLTQLISASNFELVCTTARDMSLAEDKPASLARLLQNVLAHVIPVKSGIAIKTGDKIAKEEATDFQSLFDCEWNHRVCAPAMKRIRMEKPSQVDTIPVTEDLVKLRNVTVNEMQQLTVKILTQPCASDWKRLAKLTVCRLILFNARRRAEVTHMKVTDYLSRPDWKNMVTGEMESSMNKIDAMLIKRYDLEYSCH